jgi:hypothetical protein
VSELAVWTLYAFFVLAYDFGLPPAVAGASPVFAHAAICVAYFAAILGLLNFGIRQSKGGHRIRGLILLAAVVLALPSAADDFISAVLKRALTPRQDSFP